MCFIVTPIGQKKGLIQLIESTEDNPRFISIVQKLDYLYAVLSNFIAPLLKYMLVLKRKLKGRL